MARTRRWRSGFGFGPPFYPPLGRGEAVRSLALSGEIDRSLTVAALIACAAHEGRRYIARSLALSARITRVRP